MVHIIHEINLELLLFLAQIVVLVWLRAACRFPQRAAGRATVRGNARGEGNVCKSSGRGGFLQPLRSAKDKCGFLTFEL